MSRLIDTRIYVKVYRYRRYDSDVGEYVESSRHATEEAISNLNADRLEETERTVSEELLDNKGFARKYLGDPPMTRERTYRKILGSLSD